MGLSNDERYTKIIFSINKIVSLSKELDKSNIKELCEKLWFSFLQNESNNAFWLFGSETQNPNVNKSTLFGAAICCHIPTIQKKRKKFEDKTDYNEHLESMEIILERTNSISLLDRSGFKQNALILEIFIHTENISYALCRYDDKFSNTYTTLNKTIRDIQGECFNEFSLCREFAQAQMLESLVRKIYTYTKDDLVNQWWEEQNLHHNIVIRCNKYNEIYSLFKNFQFKTLSIFDRIKLTLILVGSKYHYQHQHLKLIEMIKSYNENEEKIDIEKIKKLLNQHNKELKKENNYTNNLHCDFTGSFARSKKPKSRKQKQKK